MLRFTPLLALAIAVQAGASRAAEPLAEGEVLARVNGEVIVAGDLLWEAQLILEQRLASLPPEARANVPEKELNEAKRKMVQELLFSRLDMMLMYADFRSSVPMADLSKIHANLEPQFMTQEIPNLLEKLDAENLGELKTIFRRVGTSMEERKQDYYRKSIASAWLTESVSFDEEVTHEQMLDYYREHRADYDFDAQAKWEELMVRFDRHPTKREAWAAICVLGNQAHPRAAAVAVGEPAFAPIAQTGSEGVSAADGGVFDWTTKGSLAIDALDKAIFTLPPGQLSPIIEGPSGYHIVRVIERKDAGRKPFRDVQAKIRDKIKNGRFQKAVQQKVVELKRDARLWTVFTGDIDASGAARTADRGTKVR
ncbi:MAG: peptidyl-prolyl cis-trans isomerase [Planctomycetota bacterium]